MTKKNEKPETTAKTNQSCDKFCLAITNYALGQEITMPKEELYEHLSSCPKCQNDLNEWVTTVNLLRAEIHDATPEAQRKKADLLAELKGRPVQIPTMPDTISTKAIGIAAGTVWHCLGEHGPLPLTILPEKCKLDMLTANNAVVWLLSERKLHIDEKKRPNIVSLTSKEQDLYFHETGKLGQI